MLTFNRAAEAITGIAGGEARRPAGRATCCSCRARSHELFDAASDGRRSCRASSTASRARDGRQIELGISARRCSRRAARAGSCSRSRTSPSSKKQEREARVQQRLAAVGEMAAGIAHEIRNPLASMAGSIQILRDELPLTAEQSQLMDIVLRESDRLNDTIRSFLAYARPQRAAVADMDVRQVADRHGALLAEQRRA